MEKQMTTYTITINELQLSLIEKALKLLQDANDVTMDEEQVEETSIMVDMFPMMREDEAKYPGTMIHGWCY